MHYTKTKKKIPLVLSEGVGWAIHYGGGKNSRHSVHKLSLAASPYHLWMERYGRVLRRRSFGEREVIFIIENDILIMHQLSEAFEDN